MSVPVEMVSHDLEGHIAPHFDHLDLTIVMVPFTMTLVLHDANAGTQWCHITKKVMLHLISIILT